MTTMTIELAASAADIEATFAVMTQLRPQLAAADYVPRIQAMLRESRYQLACVKIDGVLVAVAGFRLAESLSWGRFIYVDDLISDAQARSRGHGEALLEWIAAYGKARGCSQLHLDSGVQRHAAHRFYLRERMDITCYHFSRAL